MKIKTKELFNCRSLWLSPLFELTYPWQILSENESYIKTAVEKGLEGYSRIGQNILVAEGVKIYPTATVEGYAIIGSGSVLRPGAFLRGNVIIGKNCVIGNSTEMKNSVILDGVQIPHYNYVGDSVLGNNSHLGAGAICSNLKNDSKNVVVHADVDYDTGRRKLGAFLADGANVGCGCVLNPGTVIGKNTDVYPMNSLRGVYPENSIVKADGKVVLKSI